MNKGDIIYAPKESLSFTGFRYIFENIMFNLGTFRQRVWRNC